MQKFSSSPQFLVLVAALRSARRSADVSQEELARRLKVHQTLISKVEKGRRNLDFLELRAWLRALDVDLAFFAANVDVMIDDLDEAKSLQNLFAQRALPE